MWARTKRYANGGLVWLAAAALVAVMAAGCYTVVSPYPESAEPIDATTLGDLSRGVVIEGICPAEVEPVTVTSDIYNYSDDDDWVLRATPHLDKVVLEWAAPDVPNLSGYMVARYSWVSDFDDSYRIFPIEEVSTASAGEERFVDSDGIEAATWYHYKVFPVTSEGLGHPPATRFVWTPPANPPPAPSYVTASPNTDGEIGIGIGFGFHAWKKGVRIARRSAGETEWSVVHEEVPGNSRDNRVEEHDYWADTRVNATMSQEYAVCVSNGYGFGRATLAVSTPRFQTVPVGPPQNVGYVVSRGSITVYWDLLESRSVTGYQMETPNACGRSPTYRLEVVWSDGQNHASCSFGPDRLSPGQRTRVRATTAKGPGPWSDYLEVDTSHIYSNESKDVRPEIVNLNASHDTVYGVWKIGREDSKTRYRILRRQVGLEEEYRALQYGQWGDLSSYDSWKRISLDWNDKSDLRPDTEYEYAVQLRRDETVHPPSEPLIVKTAALPSYADRRPLRVLNFSATPTERGFLLTWELPDDPTLTGLQLLRSCYGASSHCVTGDTVLPPDATSYLVLTDDYAPNDDYYFWLRTINDYGMQYLWGHRLTVDGGELSHCQATTADIGRNAPTVVIDLHSCEKSRVHVIRRELTLNGFEVTRFDAQCPWESYPVVGRRTTYDGTNVLWWRYADFDVKPGTWYIYEIHQTFGNGSTEVTFHESLTSQWAYEGQKRIRVNARITTDGAMEESVCEAWR